MKLKRLLLPALTIALPFLSAFAAPRPNILLIVVDDMGFSDLGCTGGEIATPNLDTLAEQGLMFTNFTNNAKCETTRTSMLSGRYHTEVYAEGTESVITIPENLKLAGYETFIVGKWHIFALSCCVAAPLRNKMPLNPPPKNYFACNCFALPRL